MSPDATYSLIAITLSLVPLSLGLAHCAALRLIRLVRDRGEAR